MPDDVRRDVSAPEGSFEGMTTWFFVPSSRVLTWARGSAMVSVMTLMVMSIVVGVLRLSSPPSLAPGYLFLGLSGCVLILCGWLGLWTPLVASARRASEAQPGTDWVAFGQMALNTPSRGGRIGRGWGLATPDALEIWATHNWISPRAKGRSVALIPWEGITEIRSFRATRFMAPVLRVRTNRGEVLDLDLVPRSGFSGRCITPREVRPPSCCSTRGGIPRVEALSTRRTWRRPSCGGAGRSPLEKTPAQALSRAAVEGDGLGDAELHLGAVDQRISEIGAVGGGFERQHDTLSVIELQHV